MFDPGEQSNVQWEAMQVPRPDSAYSDDDMESTTTINSERLGQFENDITYLFPIEDAKPNMEHTHEGMKYLLNGLCMTSLQGRERVLDIGAGFGVWAFEVGDRYKSLIVDAVDANRRILPDFTPPNVIFVLDNIEYDLGNTRHDFIFCRDMGGSIRDWPKLVRNCFLNLVEGGVAEFTEFGTVFSAGGTELAFDHPVADMMMTLSRDCQEKFGQPLNPGPNLKEWLKLAGFRDITQKTFRIMLNHGNSEVTERVDTYSGLDTVTRVDDIEQMFRTIYCNRIAGLCETLEHRALSGTLQGMLDGLRALHGDDGIEIDIVIVCGMK
jgi:SAM-dependent methyltransferase